MVQGFNEKTLFTDYVGWFSISINLLSFVNYYSITLSKLHMVALSNTTPLVAAPTKFYCNLPKI